MNNQTIQGSFVKILKGGKEYNWALLMFKPQDGSKTFVVYARNNVPNLFVQYEITLSTNSKSYDNKILNSYIPIIASKEINWEEYFAKHIPLIGKTTAKKINDLYGSDIFLLIKELDEHHEELLEVLSEKQIKSFVDYYSKNSHVVDSLMVNNSENDIKFFYANNLQSFYEKLVSLIKNKEPLIEKFALTSPYSLYFDYGLELNDVDKFALALDVHYQNNKNEFSNDRFEAYVDSLLKEKENNNSTLILINEVASDVAKILDFSKSDIIERFKFLIAHQKLRLRQINSTNYLTRNETFLKEQLIIKTLQKIKEKKPTELTFTANEEFENLSNEQKEAFYHFLNENISVVSGGPGTGKSHLIHFINQTLIQNGYENLNDYFIVAPTGRAATNVSIKIKEQCKTIHSMLKIDRNERDVDEETLRDLKNTKIIVIDEFSMVNVNIFAKLLYACPNLEKLVLIGDVEQLPAIGPGNLLEEIIKFNLAKTTFLEKNFRSEYKEIVEHFNAIKHNQIPVFKKNIVDLIQYDSNIFTDKVVDLFVEQTKDFSLDNVILLTPSYKGNAGIINLNNKIQQKINPNSQIVYTLKKFKEEINFKLNDRVIQLENRVSDDVYNGDIGYIKKVEKDKENKHNLICVEFKRDNAIIEIKYTENEFREQVNLAYGITVHKFQGSEIDSVLFVVNPQYQFMTTKKLVYTATSRAIKHLTITTTNDCDYFDLLIKNSITKERILTNFEYILKGE